MGFFALSAIALITVAGTNSAGAAEKTWITDSATNCRIQVPFADDSETVTWSGNCINGIATGPGVLQSFKGGKPADRYEGGLNDGLMHGPAILTTRNGDTYKGQFQYGVKQGQGLETKSDGSTYDGDFKHDKANGRGMATFPMGHYEGEFKDGDFHGIGKLVLDDLLSYEGQWRAGKWVGRGRLENPKLTYYGDFEKEAAYGHGITEIKNGDRIVGKFYGFNNLHGPSLATKPDGTLIYKVWRDGEPVMIRRLD